MIAIALAVCMACVLAGCQTQTGQSSESEISAGDVTFQMPESVALPAPSNGETIDITHVADGYVTAQMSSAAKLKFQMSNGSEVYNYDLPNDGTSTVFPLNMGDGNYRFRIMKNMGGNDYVEAESKEAHVELASEYAPYLIPNQFCSYNEESACVAKAHELANGAATQREAVERIYDFIVGHVKYDFTKARALSGTTGYIPNPDETLADGTGVCFDYASLGGAMLRSLGLPTKVITGYVAPGDLYHAWIEVHFDDSEDWGRLDLTFAAAGSNEFTGDGTSYTDRYVY